MREIKFRAWCKLDKVMHDWERVKSEFTMEYFDDEGLVFQQYAGIKDKNGIEIYKGDVVVIVDGKYGNKFKGVVSFKNASYVIKSSVATHYRWIDYDCEVIGNIHENPELLEG